MTESSDGVFAVHSNPATQAGFTILPNAVLLRRDLSPEAKLVYAYLKHLAWRGRASSVETPLVLISEDLSFSERATQRYVKELCAAPALEGATGKDAAVRLVISTRRGLGLPNTYLINDPVFGESRTATLSDPDGRSGVSSRERDPSRGQDLEPKTFSPLTSPRPENRPATVARKPVTDDEYESALMVLAAFNRHAGTRYTSGDWVAKIISRLREHPELPLPAHEIVIQRVLAEPWWQGDPSPSVIYGNAGIFERSVHAVRTQPEERSLTPDEILKLRG